VIPLVLVEFDGLRPQPVCSEQEILIR